MDKILPNTTQVPNVILDQWLPRLKDVELRVLLIIIRQTLGWIEDYETGRRKEKDWISHYQLREKTGRKDRAISAAVKVLVESHRIIEALDERGNLLDTAQKRQMVGNKIFYRINLRCPPVSLFDTPAKNARAVHRLGENAIPPQNLRTQNLRTTKETLNTKEIHMRQKPHETAPHNNFVKFWHETTRVARGIDPITTGKDGRNLKRVLDLGVPEIKLEQAALYFLCNYGFQKFSPSISIFLSAGIINGLLNRMKNDAEFWKDLNSYSERLKYPQPKPQERLLAAELQKMKADLFKVLA